jgi:hypothetical protein
MKRFLISIALTMSVAIGVSTQVPDRTGAGDAQKEFDALLERVRKSDESVDFTRLRTLYAESNSYAIFRDDDEDEMIDLAVKGRHAEAREKARAILRRNYMDIEAHMASVVVCNALNDEPCSAHHLFVARGVLNSIHDSGDGKTMKTAYVVISVPEEYALLRVLGVERLEQSLVRADDGKMYDVLKVRDISSREESSLIFNVDASMAATDRILGLK